MTPPGTSVEQGLDALIAEHVFGEPTDIKELMFLSINAEPGSSGISPEVFEACWADPKWWGHTPATQERARELYIRHYSTSISDAWRVVERMRELGYAVSFGSDNRYADWGASFTQHDRCDACKRTGSQNHYAEDESLPRAICLAALKSLGIKPSLSPDGRG